MVGGLMTASENWSYKLTEEQEMETIFPSESLLVHPTLFWSILCSWYVILSFLVARMAFLYP